MSQQPTAAQQHQQLVAQEQNLLARKGALNEQLEALNLELSAVRAVLQGAKIGFAVAQESVEKASATPDEAPAPDKE